ncbi:MAG: DUF6046 domain-containing protein [Candidatus Azobacteroides sp.]|nr:DUF6046 domain-containing protein [Candidatus Azobacteroides sp.]
MAINEISINRLLSGADVQNAVKDMAAIVEEKLEDAVRTNFNGFPMVFPLLMKRTDESVYWLLPTEPEISVTGQNNIVTRSVSKGDLKGTIKENWSQKDYDIVIKGLLMDPESKAYPKKDVQRLRNYCESKVGLDVQCRFLEIFGISKMVVTKCEMPFTEGENTQNFTITAQSDASYDLFIKLNEEENNV